MVKLGKRDTLSGHMAPRRIESAQVERLVRQALDRVVNENDRDTILRIALLNHGERAIPKRPGPLTLFVLGALRDAVVEFADDDAAQSVVRTLKPLLKMKSELELEVEDDEEEGEAEELGATIIVVDADAALRTSLVRWLRDAGHHAVAAPDAMVALAMSVRRRPDLLVIDAGQPRSSKQLEGLLGVAFGPKAPSLLWLGSSEAALPRDVEREPFLASVTAALASRPA